MKNPRATRRVPQAAVCVTGRKGRIRDEKPSPYPFHNQSPVKGSLSGALNQVFCSSAPQTPIRTLPHTGAMARAPKRIRRHTGSCAGSNPGLSSRGLAVNSVRSKTGGARSCRPTRARIWPDPRVSMISTHPNTPATRARNCRKGREIVPTYFSSCPSGNAKHGKMAHRPKWGDMGLAEWFSGFCSNIQVKDGGTISTRYKNITKRLNTDFWDTSSETSHSLYVGSYGRNTAIQGFSDLDIIFQLPYSEYEKYNNYSTNGQSALLQYVKKIIEKTYSTTSIRADGQVICVPFNDGITFEVVPAFINNNESFTYPDANNGGDWRTTNPKPELKIFKERNAACNGNLIPLCRMMRAWRDKRTVPIKGLLVDTLAYQFIEKWEQRDKSFLFYDFMCRDFFKWMSEQDPEQDYWKSPGSGQYVYAKGLFQYKAKQCYNISLEAIAYETATPKQEWSARQKWREIFGTKFPD